MRTAPVDLCHQTAHAFQSAADFAVPTHRHPLGYLSAGAFAYLIASIIEGLDLATSATDTLAHLKTHQNHDECARSLEKAVFFTQ